MSIYSKIKTTCGALGATLLSLSANATGAFGVSTDANRLPQFPADDSQQEESDLSGQVDCGAVSDADLDALGDELVSRICPEGFENKGGFRVMSHDRMTH